MGERLNMTLDDELRNRFEEWRAAQFKETGRIPTLADGARILVYKGLVAEGIIKKEPDQATTPSSENCIHRPHKLP